MDHRIVHRPPHHKHSRTVAIIRVLRALGPLPKAKKKIPRQQQPDAIRLGYYRSLEPTLQRMHAAFAHEMPEIIRLLEQLRREQELAGKMDAGEKKRALELVDRAAKRSADAFRPREVEAVAMKWGKATSDFQKEQLSQQVQAAFGVPLSAVEKPITAKLEGFAALNVDLVKTIDDRYFDRIRKDVLDAFDSGMHPDTLADDLVERYGMAENDAMRIARDQIGKLNGQLNEERQVAMGVDGYIWRTANDNRVRDEHEALEGERFAWDSPPSEGNPGEPIQCRCYAEPDFSTILGDLTTS